MDPSWDGAQASASVLPHGQLFESELLTALSDLINRWTSYHFQTAHASRLDNGLDFTSNRVLYVLGTQGPSRPSALAQQLATGRPNVSKVIARLTQQGLLDQSADPTDSRAVVVSLTAQGMRMSRMVFHIGDLMVRELTDGWSEDDIGSFAQLVARLNVAAAAYEERIRTQVSDQPDDSRDGPS